MKDLNTRIRDIERIAYEEWRISVCRSSGQDPNAPRSQGVGRSCFGGGFSAGFALGFEAGRDAASIIAQSYTHTRTQEISELIRAIPVPKLGGEE